MLKQNVLSTLFLHNYYHENQYSIVFRDLTKSSLIFKKSVYFDAMDMVTYAVLYIYSDYFFFYAKDLVLLIAFRGRRNLRLIISSILRVWLSH